ncbi:acyl-CoA-binding domain-containing protein 5A isoform X3 [Scleropages formosus]|uniref:acyl-CoA-binding domain-containing protein 5A isoform X3 n=1 Tax=Scleropages formosus TaxID=113540 RepID=UPI0010FAB101|nr:acyl-CoA-binding domain-containing protein 5 isoform X3 [Scleropages formosus]
MMMMSMTDERTVHERRFDAAVKVIKSLPANGPFQPSNEMMLKFYSYYKQATQGPCSIPRPGFWDPVGKAKWDAWNSLGDMPKEDAMIAYVEEIKVILESMPVTDEVEELLHALGPFYELVDEKKKITQVSDLTTARLEQFVRTMEGFGSMLSSPPKSVTKNIVRSLTMNGTLENHTRRAESDGRKPKAAEDGEMALEEGVLHLTPENEILTGKQNGQLETAITPLSNGYPESVPSLTNGTHSSKSALNSDESEEELLHTSTADHKELNGHITEHSEDPMGLHHMASDSDSEVYCDSMDQFGLEESAEVLVSHTLESDHSLAETCALVDGCLQTESEGVQCGGEDGKPSGNVPPRERLSAGRADSSLGRRGRGPRFAGDVSQGGLAGGGGDGERWGPEGGPRGSLNEQIVTALSRLQEDMQSVLQRLHTLEALTASQARSLALQSNYPSFPPAKKKPSWWPFDVSPGTVAFAVIWPFVVQWLIRLYLQRRRRKMN